MKRFLDEDLYFDELKDRIKKLKKRNCGSRFRIIACVVGMITIACLIGWLIVCLVKKLNNNCCDDNCCCDDDCFEDEEDDSEDDTLADDDDFEKE